MASDKEYLELYWNNVAVYLLGYDGRICAILRW